MTKKVMIGTMDNIKALEVSDNTTIEQALNQAGFDLDDNEVIRDAENHEHDLSEVVINGKGYFIVHKNKNGC